MRKFLLYTMLVTLTSFTGDFRSVRAGQPQENSAEEQKVMLYDIERFHAAWNSGDAAAVAALFSPDEEFVSPSGAVTRTRPEIRKLLTEEFQEKFHGTTLTTSVATIQFVQEHAALAEGTYRLKGVDVFLGLETSVTGSFIFRIQKTDGRWMIEKAYILRA